MEKSVLEKELVAARARLANQEKLVSDTEASVAFWSKKDTPTNLAEANARLKRQTSMRDFTRKMVLELEKASGALPLK